MADEGARTRADAAYAAGDWEAAAAGYLYAAAAGEAADNLHRAGNAYLKARRFAEAASAYERALEEDSWDRGSQTRTNLGVAYAALKRDKDALREFREAADDLANPARYRALAGMGGSLERLGRPEEAADAYRKAVLADGNPDPGRALNNLGLSYMALGRPGDAADAFRAALELDSYASKGKAAANLGLALATSGAHTEAVRAFDRAVVDYGHTLSAPASAAYDASAAAVEEAEARARRGASPRVLHSGMPVEGWTTGELPLIPAPVVTHDVDDDIETAFFTMTEEEMRQTDREARRKERTESRGARNLGAAIGTWVAVLAVLAGLLGYAWVSGLGYPSQSMTVKSLLDAYSKGEPVESYWVAVPTGDVANEMSSLPPKFASYEVAATEGSARTSTVTVTITLEQGAPLAYTVSLLREGVGWKVNGIANDWRSTGGGS
ncbi:MAG TPA: tetratricopeptide repeat protein [Coriobacteriia bacterium]|nr:tetratricopeptide repeat protein [Coriobacteriia bacterium]